MNYIGNDKFPLVNNTTCESTIEQLYQNSELNIIFDACDSDQAFEMDIFYQNHNQKMI